MAPATPSELAALAPFEPRALSQRPAHARRRGRPRSIAGIPLVSVLYMLIVRGGAPAAGWETLTELPPAGFEMGGGFGNAIVGTVVMVGIGGVLSIPLGVLAAVFLAELGRAAARRRAPASPPRR